MQCIHYSSTLVLCRRTINSFKVPRYGRSQSLWGLRSVNANNSWTGTSCRSASVQTLQESTFLTTKTQRPGLNGKIRPKSTKVRKEAFLKASFLVMSENFQFESLLCILGELKLVGGVGVRQHCQTVAQSPRAIHPKSESPGSPNSANYLTLLGWILSQRAKL